jgi:hypothetical protein
VATSEPPAHSEVPKPLEKKDHTADAKLLGWWLTRPARGVQLFPQSRFFLGIFQKGLDKRSGELPELGRMKKEGGVSRTSRTSFPLPVLKTCLAPALTFVA